MIPAADPVLADLLEDYCQQLGSHLGDRLLQVILFGSYARGEARADSDVDVAVVLDRIDDHKERVWPMGLAGDVSVDHGLVIVPIVLSKSELEFLRCREELLAQNIDREGIVL